MDGSLTNESLECFDTVLGKVKEGDFSKFVEYLSSNKGYVYKTDENGLTLLHACLQKLPGRTDVICAVLDNAMQQAELLQKPRKWWDILKIKKIIIGCVQSNQVDIFTNLAVWAINNEVKVIIDSIINHAIKQDSPTCLEILYCNGYDLNTYQSSSKAPIFEFALEKKSKNKVLCFLLLNLRNRLLQNINVSKYEAILHHLLISSVKHNNLPIATALLQFDLNSNLKLKNGKSILTQACSSNNARIAQKLIDEGADVNGCDDKGWTALMEACRYGYYESVSVCLTAGADISARDHKGTTPLLASCMKKDNVDVMQLLLKNNARLDEKDNNGKNVLVLLVESRSYYGFRELIRYWDYSLDDKTFEHFLHLKRQGFDTYDFLIDRSVVRKMTYTQTVCMLKCVIETYGIHSTIPFGKLDNLLKRYSLENQDAQMLFDIAVKKSGRIVPFFNRHDIKIDYSNYSLIYAIEKKMPVVVLEKIMKRTQNLNATNENLDTALHLIAAGNKLYFNENTFDFTEKLIKRGADVNAINNEGKTPLHLCKNSRFASLLCAHNASIIEEGACNVSPWTQAVMSKNIDILSVFIDNRLKRDETISEKFLLQCFIDTRWKILNLLSEKCAILFADVSVRKRICCSLCTEREVTLVEWVVMSVVDRNSDIDKLLYTFLIDEYENNYQGDNNIDHTGDTGVTLLMYACKLNLYQSAKKIISLGSDVNKKDSNGKNAFFYCKSPQCLKILMETINQRKLNLTDTEKFDLMSGVFPSHPDCLRLLLETGFDPNMINPKNGMCLLRNFEKQKIIETDKQAIKILFEFGYSQVDKSGPSALDIAVENENMDLVKILLQYPVEKENITKSVIKPALNNENMDLMLELLEKGFDPRGETNDFGESALILSCRTLDPVARQISSFILALKDIIPHSRDEFGRTILHLAFDNMQHHIGKVISMLTENCDVSDNFGRTFLHLWRPLDDSNNDTISKCIKERLNINQTDFNGQTALHLAYYERNEEVKRLKVNFLLSNGIDKSIVDKNGFKAFDLENFVKGQDLDIPLLQKVVHTSFKNDGLKPFSVLCESLCSEILETYDHKAFIDKLCNQFLFTWSDKLQIELQLKANTVLAFFHDIGKLMGQRQPLLNFLPQIVGSCREGTKIIAANEMDILCILKDWKIEDWGQYHNGKSTVYAMTSVNEQQKLSRIEVFEKFYFHLGQVLQNRDLWKKYPKLRLVDTYGVSHRARNITSLRLIWCGEQLVHQEIDIDVVPALCSNGELPSRCKEQKLLSNNDIYIVPKFFLDVIHSYEPDYVFQLSFNMSEADLFKIMPPAIKQGYMLAKVVKELCPCVDYIPAGDLITSYMLKTCAFKIFQSHPEFKSRIDNLLSGEFQYDTNPYPCDKLCPAHEIVDYAKRIYSHLQIAIQNQKLEGFFLPNANLLGHKTYQENFRPGLYALLCKTLLTDPKKDSEAWTELIKYQPIEYPTIHAPGMGKMDNRQWHEKYQDIQ